MTVRFYATIAPLLAALVLAAPAVAQFSEPPVMDKPQAGYYRLKIGKVDVIALSDGGGAFDILGVVPEEKKEAAARIMAKSLAKSPVFVSVNAYVILLGGRTIMVDAGTGELFGVKLGKLPDSLRAAGIAPESITDILVTHIHPDHTGGLSVGGKRTYPNATVHVNRKELDFWTDKSAGDKAVGPNREFFGQVAATVGPYIASGVVRTFEDETEIFPGIRSIPAYGHTPGHTFYVLEDADQKIAFMGDTIHVQDAQFEDPSITVAFDVDQKQAAASRVKAFVDASENGYYIALDHMPFPGIGRIRKESVGYRWLPAPYINDSVASAQALTEAQARAVIAPWYSLFNVASRGDVKTIQEQVLTTDYQSCSGYLQGECWGRDTSIKVVGNFANSIPDMKFEFKEMLLAGDRVIVRGEVSGTPAGELFGVPHTGRSFKMMAIDIQTIKDGKIAKTFHMENWLSALGQLRTK
jgi:glyoxylase-like metal-dependent hydrolase (beta-lactamase superfamily II)/predicted ester cyclase